MIYFKALNKSSPAQTGETIIIYRYRSYQPNWEYFVSPASNALHTSVCIFGVPYCSHSIRKGRCMV
jgi:hypothetical protein